MNPIKFKEQTRVLGKPMGWTEQQCGSLPVCEEFIGPNEVYPDQIHTFVSCWKPDADDVRRIVMGQPIYMRVLYDVHPPISLSTQSPFSDEVPEPTELFSEPFIAMGSSESIALLVIEAQSMGWSIKEEDNEALEDSVGFSMQLDIHEYVEDKPLAVKFGRGRVSMVPRDSLEDDLLATKHKFYLGTDMTEARDYLSRYTSSLLLIASIINKL